MGDIVTPAREKTPEHSTHDGPWDPVRCCANPGFHGPPEQKGWVDKSMGSVCTMCKGRFYNGCKFGMAVDELTKTIAEYEDERYSPHGSEPFEFVKVSAKSRRECVFITECVCCNRAISRQLLIPCHTLELLAMLSGRHYPLDYVERLGCELCYHHALSVEHPALKECLQIAEQSRDYFVRSA